MYTIFQQKVNNYKKNYFRKLTAIITSFLYSLGLLELVNKHYKFKAELC